MCPYPAPCSMLAIRPGGSMFHSAPQRASDCVFSGRLLCSTSSRAVRPERKTLACRSSKFGNTGCEAMACAGLAARIEIGFFASSKPPPIPFSVDHAGCCPALMSILGPIFQILSTHLSSSIVGLGVAKIREFYALESVRILGQLVVASLANSRKS